MNNQRRRDQTISIRLTSDEKRFIQRQAKGCKMTIANFIVMTIINDQNKPVKDILPMVESVAVLQEKLKQLQGKITPDELKDIMDKQAEIYAVVCDIAKKQFIGEV